MGFLDRLAGRNAEKSETQEPAQPSAELLSDAGPSSSAALSSAVPEYSPGQSPVSDGQQPTRLYNPYQVGSGDSCMLSCGSVAGMHVEHTVVGF